MFDVVLMTTQLILLSKKRGGGEGHTRGPVALAFVVVVGTGYLLKLATPPFGKLIAEQARRYGELRAAHSRVITHAEEIAFYRGEEVEQHVLQQCYNDLIRHVNYILRKKIWYTMLEQFLMRYVWGACGMTMIALRQSSTHTQRTAPKMVVDSEGKRDFVGSRLCWLPPLPLSLSSPAAFMRYYNITSFQALEKDDNVSELPLDTENDNVSTRTQDFVTSRGLLISAADAIERMMSSWKEVTELAGRTARIYEMVDIFDQVKRGEYVKIQTTSATIVEIKDGEEATEEAKTADGKVVPAAKKGKKKMAAAAATGGGKIGVKDALVTVGPSTTVNANGGGIVYDNSPYIELKNVPVVTPNGDMLLDEPYLSFTIKPGMHLLITGPNGCGVSRRTATPTATRGRTVDPDSSS